MSKINSLKELKQRKKKVKQTIVTFEDTMERDLNKVLHPVSFIREEIGGYEGVISSIFRIASNVKGVSGIVGIGTMLFEIYKLYKRRK